MATSPPKPRSEEELERLRWENAELRATNERLRKNLEKLMEAQRKLAKAHAQLQDTHRQLMREREAAEPPSAEILVQLRKGRSKRDS